MADVAIGQVWYVWGRHYTVTEVDGEWATILPPDRTKARGWDTIEMWRLLKFGKLTN